MGVSKCWHYGKVAPTNQVLYTCWACWAEVMSCLSWVSWCRANPSGYNSHTITPSGYGHSVRLRPLHQVVATPSGFCQLQWNQSHCEGWWMISHDQSWHEWCHTSVPLHHVIRIRLTADILFITNTLFNFSLMDCNEDFLKLSVLQAADRDDGPSLLHVYRKCYSWLLLHCYTLFSTGARGLLIALPASYHYTNIWI